MTTRKKPAAEGSERARKGRRAAPPGRRGNPPAAVEAADEDSLEPQGEVEAGDADDSIAIDPESIEAEALEAELVDEDLAVVGLAGDAPRIGPGDGEEIAALAHALSVAGVAAAERSTALVPTDALSRYLAETRQYPLLSREEEHEIAVRYYETGDRAAAIQLVTANLRLVVMVAREYQRAFQNLLDLIQEGNVGLLEAVKQFDPYRGVRFPSYAVWWIRAYIIRYIMNNFRLVKLGTTQAQRRLFFNLQKEKARLQAKGFEPTPELIAEHLGVKEKEVIEMDRRMAAGSEVSVEAPIGGEDGGTVMDLLPATTGTAEDEVAEGEFYSLMKEKLGAFEQTLSGRELEIFNERLMAEEPLTLQELGDRYGVSRERVRQMEAALKKRLREYLVEQVRDLGDITL